MTEKSKAEQLLIEQAAAGNRAAFAELVNNYYERIFRTAYKWCGNSEDAEDIAQEVCIKLGHAIRSFNGDAAFSTWLYRITLNMIYDLKRADNRHRSKINALSVVTEETYIPDQESELTRNQLWQSVRCLPDRQREAVLLIHSEGLSHQEAAKIMDCPESTVSWYIHEAKKTLKTLLGADKVAT